MKAPAEEAQVPIIYLLLVIIYHRLAGATITRVRYVVGSRIFEVSPHSP